MINVRRKAMFPASANGFGFYFPSEIIVHENVEMQYFKLVTYHK